jgi:hypothetical protein
MKKSFALLCVAVISLIIPLALAAQTALQPAADTLMQRWRTAISREDVNGYVSCYWPDATNHLLYSDGEPGVLGVRAIRERQQRWADTMDCSTLDMNYPRPSRFFPASGDMCVYSYVLEQFREIAVFYMQLRVGELRILRQVDMSY